MDVDDVFVEAIANRYRIERELGRGGMAIVYLAQDVKHRRPVALKVLRPEVATTVGAERFLREIAIAARLVHPNILPLHDSGEAAGRLYYVMPYVEGNTLRQRLDREKQLPLGDVADITSQVAAALDHAHAQGVVHRDVKPDNVLLVGDRVLMADFGLARALTSAASSPLTRTGTVVGTPAYMSPEQCAPGSVVDARSDVYALACMVFEMIAGVTPFRGATAQAMIAHQMSGDPPSVCAERERCPRAVDDVVQRGLAKSPADRYQRAGELAGALAGAIRSDGGTPSGNGSAPRRERRTLRWLTTGSLALAMATTGWLVSQRALGAKPALERSTYAVFPFRQASPVLATGFDGAGTAQLLRDAMAHWQGVNLVDDMRIGDLWARHKPESVEDALRAAEELHAGQVAWGSVRLIGDSLQISVVAYDVARGPAASRQFDARVGVDMRQLDSTVAALADSIVIGGTGLRGTSALGTHNLKALYQFLDGKRAVERFDFPAAEAHFGAAARTDERYAGAHLWLARMRAWRGGVEPSAWLGDASRAVALSSSLSERDAWHAKALRSLADGNAPRACRLYNALISSDSTDIAAWLGLGDCNARDDAVVHDPRSATGYSFRGSYYRAITAYRQALILAPSLHQAERGLAFERLSQRVLYTQESRMRRGVGVPPDKRVFIAFPALSMDTLAFVPTPFANTARSFQQRTSEHRAVVWAAEMMSTFAKDWVEAFAASADAQSAYASALEAVSSLNGSSSTLLEALDHARRAAARTRDADVRVARTVAVVRLLLKSDSTETARALAGVAIGTWTKPSPRQAGFLANLAELTGRPMQAAALLRLAASDSEHIPFLDSAGRRLSVPSDVMQAALQLRAYAPFDAPHDSVIATFRRTERLINAWITESDQEMVRTILLSTPIVLAGARLGGLSGLRIRPVDSLAAMRFALLRGDTNAARVAGNGFAASLRGYTPGTMGLDRMLAYTEMLLALGDTATASQQLNDALDALPRARDVLLAVTPQAAAVGNAILLRGQLAAKRGETATARRDLRALEILWRDAEPALRERVQGFRQSLPN